MTNDKRDKMIGKPVSKEEILRDLGHPGSWSASSRKQEFKRRLKPGQKDLGLGGIKGFPGHEGYLEYLEKEFKNPLGTNTSLVSDEENAQILLNNRAEIQLEIDKYRALLEKYEQDPRKIAGYIAYMNSWLKIKINFSHSPRERTGDPDLDASSEAADEQDAEDIEAVRARINEYLKKYEALTGKKLNLIM